MNYCLYIEIKGRSDVAINYRIEPIPAGTTPDIRRVQAAGLRLGYTTLGLDAGSATAAQRGYDLRLVAKVICGEGINWCDWDGWEGVTLPAKQCVRVVDQPGRRHGRRAAFNWRPGWKQQR